MTVVMGMSVHLLSVNLGCEGQMVVAPRMTFSHILAKQKNQTVGSEMQAILRYATGISAWMIMS